jgi:acyl-CoA thioesterase-2
MRDVPTDWIHPAGGEPPAGVTLAGLLRLEQLDVDLYRSTALFEGVYSLYGGQVFAQALLAAGRTVPPDRLPHSAHGYFLRPGDSAAPVVFVVERDRDGRNLSARRVVAQQGGKVILNLSASFAVPDPGTVDETHVRMPAVEGPGAARPAARVVGFEESLPPQAPVHSYPSRAWLRCTEPVGDDPLLDAVLLAYVSDLYTGLGRLPSSSGMTHATINHTLWLHRPLRAGSWALSDMEPRSISNGRGFYAGRMWSPDGTLVASFMQETVYRSA